MLIYNTLPFYALYIKSSTSIRIPIDINFFCNLNWKSQKNGEIKSSAAYTFFIKTAMFCNII